MKQLKLFEILLFLIFDLFLEVYLSFVRAEGNET